MHDNFSKRRTAHRNREVYSYTLQAYHLHEETAQFATHNGCGMFGFAQKNVGKHQRQAENAHMMHCSQLPTAVCAQERWTATDASGASLRCSVIFSIVHTTKLVGCTCSAILSIFLFFVVLRTRGRTHHKLHYIF